MGIDGDISDETYQEHLETEAAADDLAVVIITRNRRAELAVTLRELAALPEHPLVVVVDNGSDDGTPDLARAAGVRVVALEHNLGAAARTVGVREAGTAFVAFSDDDSWWAPGALAMAVRTLRDTPTLGLICGRVLVGAQHKLDPVCQAMQDSALPPVPGVGPRVLGFVACGAVVRASAYLQVGGFHARFGVGGEESLLCMDLAERGWDCAYVDAVVAHHHPSTVRNPVQRRARQVRNDLWTSWLRRSPRTALAHTARTALRTPRDAAARTGLLDAARGARWVLAERSPVGRRTESQLRLLDSA